MKKEVIAICLLQFIVINAHARYINESTGGYALQQNTKDEKTMLLAI